MAKDPKVRAKVVALIQTGAMSIRQIAKECDVSVGFVQGLKGELTPEQVQEIVERTGRDFGEMVGDYLEETLKTLKVQAEFFRDPKWMMRQSAKDMATLHGVQADKTMRAFEAAAKRESERRLSQAGGDVALAPTEEG